VLLGSSNAFDEGDEPAIIVGLLSKALATRCPSAQAIVLSASAPVLAANPSLLPPFVECLVEMPSGMRAGLLGGSTTTVATAGGLSLTAPPLPASWPPLLVATGVMDTARARSLDTLEPAYTEVHASLLTEEGLTADGAEYWGGWLKNNKDYLYVALCDDELCGTVTSALLPLFTLLREDALPTFSTLLSSLRMVCDNAPTECATAATNFLLAVHGLGAPFVAALENLVSNFDAPMRDAFTLLVQRVEAA
jgi:hypothetical protein